MPIRPPGWWLAFFMAEQTHEDYRSHTTEKLPSNRSFGLVFTVFFALLAFWPLARRGEPVRLWAAVASGVMLLLTLVAPNVLQPANRLWMKLGHLLGRIVNPIILSGMFFLLFTPIAFLLRLLGKDLLRWRRDAQAASYWIGRDDIQPDTMKNQF